MTTSPIGRREARKEDRRKAILAAAECSFFELGYAGTSMSGIAAALGGSKTTLWSYFASKEELFEALLDSKISAFSAALDAALILDDGVGAALARFGEVFLTKLLRPDFRAMRRLIEAEGERFPEIAVAMYERGPKRTHTRLAIHLAAAMDRGALRRGDPTIAARQFIGLCQAMSFSDRIWHRPNAPDPDPAADVALAIETFLHGWRPGRADGSSNDAAMCSNDG